MNESFIMWVTGPPASGKSTLTQALLPELRRRLPVGVLESDRLREILTPQPTYEAAERDQFYRVLGDLALLLAGQGIGVIVDATAPSRDYRDRVRRRCRRFVEVAVRCSTEECERRDPKGIYRLAREGKIRSLPGLQVDYAAPLHPEFVYDSQKETANEAARRLLHHLINSHLVEEQQCVQSRSSD